MTYYFVGTHTVVAHIDPNSHAVGARVILDKLGATVEANEDEATDWMRGGAALLTEDEFKGIGFTEDELKTYDYPGKQVNAPQDFKDKQKKAWSIYGEKWQALRGLKAAAAAAPAPTESPVAPALPVPQLPPSVDERVPSDQHSQ